ncbi:NUDIX domain-containing protein [Sesbania bispinosa]|nr:NUDIX domain-containing protein [Sesbania bispinosa]
MTRKELPGLWGLVSVPELRRMRRSRRTTLAFIDWGSGVEDAAVRGRGENLLAWSLCSLFNIESGEETLIAHVKYTKNQLPKTRSAVAPSPVSAVEPPPLSVLPARLRFQISRKSATVVGE